MSTRSLLAFLTAIAALIVPAAANFVTFGVNGSAPSLQYPTVALWFYGFGNNDITTFLGAGKQPGVGIVSESGTIPDHAAIASTGYQIMAGIGDYAAACMQNDPVNCGLYPTGPAQIEALLDGFAASGAKWVYINEPCVTDGDYTTGLSDPCSIPYNAVGMALLLAYRDSKGYRIKIGYSLNNSDAATTTFPQLFTWTQNNGYELMDFAQEEFYNSTCCYTADPWGTFHAGFPNAQRSSLIYSTNTFCSAPYVSMTGGKIDMISFWDVDNYGGWIGPLIDPNQITNGETIGSGAAKTAVCNQTFSEVSPGDWTHTPYASNASLSIVDGSYSGFTSPYTISSCDYQVYSGSSAINGIRDPSVTQTNPSAPGWDSRTCNASITITVGASQECRNDGSSTCIVVVRNHNNSGGGLGDATWYTMNIAF